MRRFAYICADPGIPVPGSKGASAHVAGVCRALVEQGLTGVVYAARAEDTDLAGLPVVPIPHPRELSGESPAGRETRLFLSNVDRAHPVNGCCDFYYERYSLWHVAGLARARELGAPFILEVNSPLPEEAERYRSLAHQELAHALARFLMSEADGIVCVSDAVAEWVRRQRGTHDGVWVVPNGVDEELFSPSAPARTDDLWKNDGPVIGFCGSFRPWHGTDDLLEACRLLDQEGTAKVNLLCVGDGPLRESFERRAQSAGLADRVHVTGAVPQEQVASWLRTVDVAVAPYPRLEDFYFSPLKIFEFLALGLPVVAADAGQIPSLLAHGRRGRLYRAGRPRDLARALAESLRDPVDARARAHAGRQWVLGHATWSRRVTTILHHVDSLIDRKARGIAS